MKLMYFAAVLAVLGVPASAQVVTSPTKIADSNNDGIIKLEAMASKVTPPLKKGTTVVVCTEVEPFTYAVKGTPCPAAEPAPPVVVPPVVMPPVVTPPTGGVVEALLPTEANTLYHAGKPWPGVGAALQSAKLSLGFNAAGTLGTLKPLPSPFLTDTRTGLLRLAMYDGVHDDLLAQGRNVRGYTVTIGGVGYSNMPLNGRFQIPGQFVSPTEWRGGVGSVALSQVVQLTDAEVVYAVTIKNVGTAPVAIGYLTSTDPDQSEDNAGGTKNFSTVNRVVAEGAVEAGLYGQRGGTYYIGTDTPGAYIATAAIGTAHVAGVRRPVGTVRTADDVLQLVFAPVTLAAGEAVTLRYREGVRP